MTKTKPVDVTAANEQRVRAILYNKPMPKRVKFKYKAGQKVRITREKHRLEKGYLPTFTKEVFTISERLSWHPPVYQIVDENNEPIIEIFYENELVKAVNEPEKPRKRKKPVRFSW